MFDTQEIPTVAPSREQILAELRRRIGGDAFRPSRRPTAPLAVPGTSRKHVAAAGIDSEVLPVLGPLAEILPRGGLPRGGVVAVQGGKYPAEPAAGPGSGQRAGPGNGRRAGPGNGQLAGPGNGRLVRLGNRLGADGAGAEAWTDPGPGGASSLLLSLLASPTPRWTAVVGMPDIGLVAAAELGADLERLVVIPDPGPDVLHVVSVLVDGVELIVAGAPCGPWGTPARLRVLSGRLRQHGTVLLVAGSWPGADLVLRARHTGWAGIGQGTGRLRDRELTIEVGGRRAGRPGHEHTVLLSGRRDGTVAMVDTATGTAITEPIAAPIPAAM
ncbi:hypothetical protein [Nakamurella lactea]|uniref:hypothetical protein n=1 Tax=Nakamurella lactea TaxID=459515 RepID=UPI000686E055|nr:hypothetical protein [Nakamurella lactea]